jgi:O-antigen/teichoic acid export membrane protein
MDIRVFIAKARHTFINDFILPIRSRNPSTLQPIALFGSMVLSMGLTFLSSIITARMLGPNDYGNLKYITTVWGLLALGVTVGYFYCGSRVLVLEGDTQKCREISGTILIISLIMGTIICLITLLISVPLDYIFHVDLAYIMIPLAPLIVILPLNQSLYLILQSTNQIYLLAILTALPAALYLVSIYLLSALKQITISSVLIAQQLTILIVIIFIVIYIKPRLRLIKFWWSEIKTHHKTYGFPVYLGALAANGTTYLNRLSISYWVDNTTIGFFSLAMSLVAPLQFIPNAIATSSFRSFAKRSRIPKKIIITTIALTIASLIAAFIFFGKPLSWIYTTKFSEVGPMARALSLGAIFIGFGDLFNRFLGAHGRGKSLQRAAYANGIASIVCIIIFVPFLGAWGAILGVVIPNGIYLLQMWLSYRKFCQENIPQ